jgi:hypothetical protein
VTGDFLEARAAIVCRGFAGHTAFSIARRDLDAFATDLAGVCDARSDAALLLGGWDNREQRLRLEVTPAGPFGQFRAHVRIADAGPRTDQWQHVETEFVLTPDTVSAFMADLQQLIDGRKTGDAKLIGDPDAIA